MSQSNNRTGGIGFFGLLALIFIALKLAEVGVVATWSWWWVLAPIWGPIVLAVAILMLGFFFYVVEAICQKGRR